MAVKKVKSTCPYCGVGCGVVAGKDSIAGDTQHPANQGALCVKGSALKESLVMPSRLLYPKLDGTEIAWGQASDEIAERMHQAIQQHGPDSVAMYVSGQLLTEDYYVANKLMKGYVGSANIDTNSRLCMSSAVAAHVRAFGEDVVPVNYDDIMHTELLVLIGSNAAWTHPVLFKRIQQARENNPDLKLVVIDPRKTVTAEQADLHLAIDNDADVLLYNGLLRFLIDNDGLDEDFIKQSTEGFSDLCDELKSEAYTLKNTARTLNLSLDEVRTFYRWFRTSSKALTLFCQGVNQSESGVDKGNAIINVHLASGKIGKPGSGPFSLTGQPNAMGGREVGGLANQLAVHRGFDSESVRLVKEYWQSPTIATQPGLKAVDLFKAVESGKIKVLWIMATNPVVSLPDSDQVRRALQLCEFVVVSDITGQSDVSAYADLILPAAGWGEKQGMVTNSERRLSRQRAFLPAPGEAKPDWWAVTQVGRKLCAKMNCESGFEYDCEADIFREFTGLSSINTHSNYLFDLSKFSSISDEEYENWQPTQWPLDKEAPYRDGIFSTANGKAQFITVKPQAVTTNGWWLNTGRQRDQWHTMTRTGHIAKLAAGEVEPTVYVNQFSAESIGLQEGHCAAIRGVGDGPDSCIFVKVKFDPGLTGKQLFMSMHWAGRYGGQSQANRTVVSAVDPLSGQPAFKSASVHIAPVKMQSYGMYVGQERDLPSGDYSAYQRDDNAAVLRFANLTTFEKSQFSVHAGEKVLRWDLPEGWMMVIGRQTDSQQEMIVTGVLLISPQPLEQDYSAILPLIGEPLSLSAIIAIAGEKAQSQLVCSCFRVTDKQIQNAIEQDGCVSLNQLQAKLKCGSNCGSCVPEVNKILNSHQIIAVNKA